jgi:cell division protein FtsB
MNERGKDRNIFSNLIFSKFFLGLCVIVLFAVLLGLAKGSVKNYQINSEIDDLKDDINNLEQKNQELSELIKYLNSSDFIEQEAKMKLGYKKPGEQVVVIARDKSNEEKNQAASIEEVSNPQKWWNYFFK